MSLRNTFRLFVVSLIIVLSSIDTSVVSFTLRRAAAGGNYHRDLAQEESIREVKRVSRGLSNYEPISKRPWDSNRGEKNVTHIPKSEFLNTYKNIYNRTGHINIDTTENEKTLSDAQNTTSESEVGSSTYASITTELQTTTIHIDLQTRITTEATLGPNQTTVKMDVPTASQVTDIPTLNNITVDTEIPVVTTDSYRYTDIKDLTISTTNKNDLEETKEQRITTKGKQFRKPIKSSSTMRTPDYTKQLIMKIDKPETTTVYKLRTIPKWKKYTTIQRLRTTFSPEEKIYDRRIKGKNISEEKYINKHDEKNNESPKKEKMINAETKQRYSLKDTVTSDIPSLEQLKNDLLSSTLKLQTFEKSTINPSTEEPYTATVQLGALNSSTTSTTTTTKWEIIESQRAGFLNLLAETVPTEKTYGNEISELNVRGKEPLQSIFNTAVSDIDVLEDKDGGKADSQSILSEDAIKEELLKEEVINDHVENIQRQREEKNDSNFVTDTTTINPEISQLDSSLDDNLSVKPIAFDKTKNTSLYAVNPNYKPLKKIEVLPPKPFVRDPDDNSWRNESLSSLGIVFKPKNSSKPFTQVLKNKTEAEWNNVTERDNKNDIPDLRERLQKMAEKRKSKRKKFDSLGNVYFDYEESSAENATVSSEEHLTTSLPTSIGTDETLNSTSSERADDATNSTTTPASPRTIGAPRSTSKFKKFFNVVEYYDTTDEDDTEYLNMAKIDLKKFTTSPKTTQTLVSLPAPTAPDWLQRITRLPPTTPPERRATVQYFPPLTTQKVNIDDYDTNFKYKIESFRTGSEIPKSTPPAFRAPAAPTYANAIEYNKSPKALATDFEATQSPNFDGDSILVRPPATTVATFASSTGDGNFDRGSFLVKNYGDFLSGAAQDAEFDRHAGYGPFTDAPARAGTRAPLETGTPESRLNVDEAYDYEAQFRRDALQRFVDNFNRHGDRFGAGLPVLFNSSVAHGGGSSSRAAVRGPPGAAAKECGPQCERLTVELSPAYELHYYVPEQEEREEVAPPPVTAYPYRP